MSKGTPCRIVEQKGDQVFYQCGGRSSALNPDLREVWLWQSTDVAFAGAIFMLAAAVSVVRGWRWVR